MATRVGFSLIGGRTWTGGYNYLLNLVSALAAHAADRVQPVLFFGLGVSPAEVERFTAVPGAIVVRSPVMDRVRGGTALAKALLLGRDGEVRALFDAHGVDVAFENAQFLGWRFGKPVIAWIPDFQHRFLRRMFTFGGYWKREFGFRMQMLSGRRIMLSSQDACDQCEALYPSTRGRTSVVRFAVPAPPPLAPSFARRIADDYELPERFFLLPNQFWRHKNHACAIEALRVLRERGHDVTIAAPGNQLDPRDPTHFARLSESVRNAGLERRFRMLGMIPLEHLHALMQTCVALINPSKFEGWSTTVEEAKSAGVRMILSGIPVHREQAEGFAEFFDPDRPEELARILLDNLSPAHARPAPHDSASAAARVREFAENFCALVESVRRPSAGG